jgi:hypothetical protein
MLGTIYDKWDKSKPIQINEGDNFVIIQGKRLEFKLEEKNHLRLSLVEIEDNCIEQHIEAVLGFMNLLDGRRKNFTLVEHELQQITSILNNDDLDGEIEEKLEKQARDKRAEKRKLKKEIEKLQKQTNIRVQYRIIKTGLTAVLPPGLTLKPKFLTEPVCWCPENLPASSLVDETKTVVKEIPITLTCPQQTTANGSGLNEVFPIKESKFLITAKDFAGKPRDVGGDIFELESKEAELKYSVLDMKNGCYEVSYSTGDVKSKQLSLAVTHNHLPIHGSPFSVAIFHPLLEFSTTGTHTGDWLDEAVKIMSSIERARLQVILYDANGIGVYKTTGVTTCKWTKNHITAPGKQKWDDQHINAIHLDNGDRMMIIGKDQNSNGYLSSAYRSYNIVINAGWDRNKLTDSKHRRRMIIARSAPNVKGWIAPDNLISFSGAGFIQTQSDKWPKFKGTFRIYYHAL